MAVAAEAAAAVAAAGADPAVAAPPANGRIEELARRVDDPARVKPVAASAAVPRPSASCEVGPWDDWLGNAQFQARAAERKRAGNIPVRIQGRLVGNDLAFRAVFAPKPERGSFNWDIYRSDGDLRTLKDVRSGKQNLRLVCAQSFTDARGEPRWQVTWASGGR